MHANAVMQTLQPRVPLMENGIADNSFGTIVSLC